MREITKTFLDFIDNVLQHPEGPEVAKVFNRTFQFDLTDADPFFMRIEGGAIKVEDGDSGLDWRYRDWDRVTCIHTSQRFLLEVISGRRIISEGFFDQEIGFAPRRAADLEKSAAAAVAWFYTLVRLSHEQIVRQANQNSMSKLAKP